MGGCVNPADIDQYHEILWRLGLATLLGATLGVNRDLHRKPAGLRVLAMVCLGSAAVTIMSVVAISSDLKPAQDGILRTVQGVLSGIGFLGAGVIMRSQGKNEVHGLTTAASIWISAILGMICGVGEVMLAICVFVLAWAVLIFGQWVEFRILTWALKHTNVSESTSADGDKIDL